MRKKKIELGDKVVVKNSTFIYPRYEQWVEKNAKSYYKKWKKHGYDKTIEKGQVGTIVAKGRHEYDRFMLYLIKIESDFHVVEKEAIMWKRL